MFQPAGQVIVTSPLLGGPQVKNTISKLPETIPEGKFIVWLVVLLVWDEVLVAAITGKATMQTFPNQTEN